MNSKYVYIALGSNLSPREYLPKAVIGLKKIVTINRISPTYRSMPQMVITQPHFLNAVIECSTTNTPLDLMRKLLSLEQEIGRVRENVQKNGPRVIDLDLLDFQSITISENELTIPHPQIENRNFVLKPLSDLNYHHPILKCSALQLLANNQTNLPVLDALKLKI